MQLDPKLELLAGGFARIEHQDVRVGRVDIPVKTFYEFKRVPGWGGHYDQERWAGGRLWKLEHQSTTKAFVGTLWGSEVHVGGTRVIVYPEGWPDRKWTSGANDREVHPCVVSEFGVHKWTPFCGAGLFIAVKSHCSPALAQSDEERIAQETLRESLTEEAWRRYMRNGFLCVRGESGRVYQIPRGSGYSAHVVVWEEGKRVAEICSYIKDVKVPPTDRVIAFKSIIEADEQEMWRRGNVFRMTTQEGQHARHRVAAA